MKKSQLRWVPALAVPAVVIAGAIAVPSMANADVRLPGKSAAKIVALAEKSAGTAFSGTVSETANLGLPDISSSELGGGSAGSSASDSLSQLTGTHKAKVFSDGDGAFRVQTLDNLAETDVIRNGTDLYTYDSKKNAVTHVTLPSKSDAEAQQSQTQPTQSPTDIATKVLAQVGKYTTVTTSDNVKVAGQKAYGITLRPQDTKTLVDTVTLDVDAKTGVPLKAVIAAKGQKDPAFSVQFTKIDYSKPSASTFAFTPPKGATVKNLTVPKAPGSSRSVHPGALSQDGPSASAKARAAAEAARAEYQPTVIGSGWSTVVGFTLPGGAPSASAGSSAAGSSQLLDQVLTPVDGGRVLQTSLVSVFLSDSGKVYVGSVSAKNLEAAVATQK